MISVTDADLRLDGVELHGFSGGSPDTVPYGAAVQVVHTSGTAKLEIISSTLTGFKRLASI